MKGVRHYPEHIQCDFCGRLTRGIIYEDDKESVKCTSCKMELTKVSASVVVNGVWENRPFLHTPHHTDPDKG